MKSIKNNGSTHNDNILNNVGKSSLWIATTLSSLLFVLLPINIHFTDYEQSSWTSQAMADSTGKFSTKLTARRRYLPRILSGLEEFEKVKADLSASSADLFLIGDKENKPKVESFVRACSLYGASLRKGEIPDAISREAEDKVKVIENDMRKLAKTRSKADMEKATSSLQAFLDFAKIEK